MVFSSLEFLFWFLPFFLAIYYLLPPAWRNACLLAFSLVFYAYGTLDSPGYLFLLLGSVLVNYLLGRLIGGARRPDGRRGMARLWLILGVLFHGGLLFFFKYAAFAADSVNALLQRLPGVTVRLPAAGQPVLPIGISFYTFQALSYLIDVYRGTVAAEKSPLILSTYMTMFPQLIAGPIVRYADVRQAMRSRRTGRKDIAAGAAYFIGGLGAKVLLANRLGGLWSAVEGIGFSSLSVPLAWMGIIAFSLQLYFDFYGYSLMAIGLGRMIGFSLPENFRHPYTARSMTDFWRRWHITLGSWFREYVYIPLGGSRQGRLRTVLNLLCVWLLTGLWHGAAWNFVLWGLFLFLLLAIEKAGFGRVLKRSRVLSRLYMLLMIPLSWLLFAVTGLEDLAAYAGRLIGLGGVSVYAMDYVKYARQYGVFLLLGLVCCTELPEAVMRRLRRRPVLLWGVLAAVLAASVWCIWQGMNDPFLYFRF